MLTITKKSNNKHSKARAVVAIQRNRMATNGTFPIFGSPQQRGRRLGDFPLFSAHDPFPPRIRVKLSHEIGQTIQTGGSAYVFGAIGDIIELNSCFQPTTPATHQPYGWDQLTPLYNNYKVVHAAISLEFTNAASSGGLEDIFCGALLSNSTNSTTLATTSVNTLAERPMVCVKHLSQSGSQKVVMKLQSNIYDVEGLTKAQFLADINSYQALTSSSPAKMPNLSFAVATITANTINVVCRIKTTYTVEMWDRVIVAQS